MFKTPALPRSPILAEWAASRVLFWRKRRPLRLASHRDGQGRFRRHVHHFPCGPKSRRLQLRRQGGGEADRRLRLLGEKQRLGVLRFAVVPEDRFDPLTQLFALVIRVHGFYNRSGFSIASFGVAGSMFRILFVDYEGRARPIGGDPGPAPLDEMFRLGAQLRHAWPGPHGVIVILWLPSDYPVRR